MFLKNRNISSKIKRSKVTDYSALSKLVIDMDISDLQKEDSMIEIQRLKNKAFKPFVYYCYTLWQTVDKDPDEMRLFFEFNTVCYM